MTQTERILQNQLQLIADNLKLKTSKLSGFEGKYDDPKRKYVMAKPFTLSIKWADARIGNRVAVVLNLPKGCITPLVSFTTPHKLMLEMQKADLKKEVTVGICDVRPR